MASHTRIPKAENERSSSKTALQRSRTESTNDSPDGYGAVGLTPRQNAILRMQHTYGNAAVLRMFAQVIQRDDDENPVTEDTSSRANASASDSDMPAIDIETAPTSASSEGNTFVGSDNTGDSVTYPEATSGTSTGIDPATDSSDLNTTLDTSMNGVNELSQSQSVISYARGEIGAVHALSQGNTDPDTGKPTRDGWENLDKYFTASYGGKGAGGYTEALQNGVKFYSGRTLPQHWCGHFAVWALKSAGFSVGNWKLGSGIAAISGIKTVPKAQIQPGDIGVVSSPFQHHFVVADVQGSTVNSIDGNSGNDSEITQNSRALGSVDGVFRPEA